MGVTMRAGALPRTASATTIRTPSSSASPSSHAACCARERRRRGVDARAGGKLQSVSGVEDGRYDDVDLESLRKAAGISGPDYSSVQRNLALELVRVTEAAALEAGRWLGRGETHQATESAVQAIRKVLGSVEIDGVVVIGEGASADESPFFYCGERVGAGFGLEVDVAIDPLDGTKLVSRGRHGALACVAVAGRGSLLDCGPVRYMDKLVVDPTVGPGVVSLAHDLRTNLAAIARATGRDVRDLTVAVLDRPRHASLIASVRECGARLMAFSDGDVAMSLEAARPGSQVDVLVGTGGAPEGVLSACAIRCMGGFMEGRLSPAGEEERALAIKLGLDLGIIGVEAMATSDEVYFAATGISDGYLDGVQYFKGGATTHSLVMRSRSGTIRRLETTHKWSQPGITNLEGGV